MKFSSVLGFGLLSLLATGAAQAADVPLERVTVFSDRAELTRSATLDCSGEAATLVVPGLPTGLDRRTLRAEASGRAEAVGTSSQVRHLEEDRDERVAKLEAEIEALDARIGALDDAGLAESEAVQRISSYSGYFADLVQEQARDEKTDLGAWGRALDELAAARRASAQRQLELQKERRGLERQRQRLARQLSKLAPQARAEALEVRVAVQCNGEARPKVSLSYVLPGATWKPEYDLRFRPQGRSKAGRGTAELTVAAVVQQASGEDWENVQLTLSTAKPKLGAEAPYPARLLVGGRPAGDKKVLVAAMERREKLAGPAEGGESGPASAELEDRGQSFVLKLPRRVTVRSDGRPYWMPVDRVSAPAETRLVAVPKKRPYVFHVIQLRNPAAYPLLPGRVHAYRGESYVGDLQTEYRAAGEPMEISLGIDEELRVERKDLDAKDRDAGFLSSTKHMRRGYRIRVRSTADEAVDVELRDSLPVTKVEDVKVELIKDRTTAGYELDAHRGFLTWTVAVKPGEEKVVDLVYDIHLPESWQVR